MSKIDWKKVAASPGYRSLKAAYQRELDKIDKERQRGHRPMRDKAEFLARFNWIICRAKHYSHRLNKPIEDVLNEWENRRSGWWFGYYGNNIARIHSNSLKPMGINGTRKACKNYYGKSSVSVRDRIRNFIRYNTPKRTKKARWPKYQHRLAKRNRNL